MEYGGVNMEVNEVNGVVLLWVVLGVDILVSVVIVKFCS